VGALPSCSSSTLPSSCRRRAVARARSRKALIQTSSFESDGREIFLRLALVAIGGGRWCLRRYIVPTIFIPGLTGRLYQHSRQQSSSISLILYVRVLNDIGSSPSDPSLASVSFVTGPASPGRVAPCAKPATFLRLVQIVFDRRPRDTSAGLVYLIDNGAVASPCWRQRPLSPLHQQSHPVKFSGTGEYQVLSLMHHPAPTERRSNALGAAADKVEHAARAYPGVKYTASVLGFQPVEPGCHDL